MQSENIEKKHSKIRKEAISFCGLQAVVLLNRSISEINTLLVLFNFQYSHDSSSCQQPLSLQNCLSLSKHHIFPL